MLITYKNGEYRWIKKNHYWKLYVLLLWWYNESYIDIDFSDLLLDQKSCENILLDKKLDENILSYSIS